MVLHTEDAFKRDRYRPARCVGLDEASGLKHIMFFVWADMGHARNKDCQPGLWMGWNKLVLVQVLTLYFLICNLSGLSSYYINKLNFLVNRFKGVMQRKITVTKSVRLI